MLSFQKSQQQFTRYLRGGNSQQIPEEKADGWRLYRHLVYENNRAIIESSFPVCWSFLPVTAWQHLIEDYLANGTSPTPYFNQAGRFFIEFVVTRADFWKPLCPFLAELMHVEHAEMSLAIAPDEQPFTNGSAFSFAKTRLGISSLAWPLLYEYPVHAILRSGEALPAGEFPVCLLLWRTADYAIKRVELAPLAFAVVEMLHAGKGITGEQIVQNLRVALPHSEMDYLQQQGRAVLQYLWAEEIVGDAGDDC